MILFYEVVVYVKISGICCCHLISAVLTCDRVFKNYLLQIFHECHGQSGSAKSGCVFSCPVSGIRFIFISCWIRYAYRKKF